MIKFKLYLDKDEETRWLNQMSAEGWAMKSFFAGFYVFEESERGKYTYQVDCGEKLFKVSDEYKEFMQEAGIEIVQVWGWWVILRKPASEGKFELYTDVESRIGHYSKIRKMFKIAAVIEIICLWIEVMAAIDSKEPYAIAGVFLIGAFVAAVIRAVIHTTGIINSLKEQQTGIAAEKQRNVSMAMVTGLLLNGMALAVQDNIARGLVHVIQIFAIVLMIVGLWNTCRKK